MTVRRLAVMGATVLGAAVLLLAACGSSSTGHGVDATQTHRVVRLPPAAGVFDYQLGGAYPPAAGTRIVDRDRGARPVHGLYNVCYVNAFQSQPDEASFWRTRHPSLLLRSHGRLVTDPDWPGEYVLDTSTAAKRTALLAIVGGWIDGCAAHDFQAVEPDNLDSWTRHGVDGAITRADDVAFARLLVRRAHADGLAIGQKNAVELAPIGRTGIGFDFAVAEECQVFRECGAYLRAYGRHVVEIEYTDNGTAAFAAACKAHRGTESIILRDRDVVPRGDPAYRYRHC